MTSRPWDVYAAELSDTRRGQFKSLQPLRPCVYCSAPTRALSQVCLAHDDPGYPSPVKAA